MPPFAIAVSILASPVAMPIIAVAFAVPILEEPPASPTATGPFRFVYKAPFIGVTIAHPDNNTIAHALITNDVSILRIVVLLSQLPRVPFRPVGLYAEWCRLSTFNLATPPKLPTASAAHGAEVRARRHCGGVAWTLTQEHGRPH